MPTAPRSAPRSASPSTSTASSPNTPPAISASPPPPPSAPVIVNRYWQMYFRTGLVKTAEDFGTQGEYPTHRDLLDYLATEFTRTGWDIKAMQRLIVTSATYRQSSRATPALTSPAPE